MSDRAARVEARLAERGADLLLVTDLVNLGYLTGFTGSNGMCVIGPGVRRFVTDFRYVAQVEAEVVGFDREQGPQDFLQALGDGWPEGPLRLGFEDQHLSVRQHQRLRAIVPDRIELVAAGGLVEAERIVKEPSEVDRIRAAAALADDALGETLADGLVGRTEREVALALEHAMRLRGGEPSFPSIVAAAEHGALPHASPRDVPIPRDTLVTIDWGARLDGYCSDCTRTFATGALTAEQIEIYRVVERAQAAAVEAVRPGPPGRDLDAVARDLISDAGHGERFGHGLGHGVGLEVHEGPRLARTGEDPLAPGQVVTVEPGVYVPGVGGVRIEDLVVVREEGPEILSSLPKHLQVVD
ncbi:MAG: M24 family metallopeptidase [Actinomycetes bacterium]